MTLDASVTFIIFSNNKKFKQQKLKIYQDILGKKKKKKIYNLWTLERY
jgi:hypothetical protein